MSFADAMRATGGDAVAAAAMVFAEAPGDKRGADETFGDTNPAPVQSARDNLYEDAVSDIAYEEPETIGEDTREAAARAEALDNPAIAEQIMLNIEPHQLPQVCGLSSFFAGICRDAVFRRAYRARWFVAVRFEMPLFGGVVDMTFFKTRKIRDVHAALAAALQLPSALIDLVFIDKSPSPDSSLAGMALYAKRNTEPVNGADMTILYRNPQGPHSSLRLWLEDGTYVDVPRN